MSHFNITAIAFATLTFCLINTSYAEEAQEPPPYEPGAAFQRIEQLAGRWVGTLWSSHNEETMPLELDYKVISLRSTIVETVIEDEIEMITLYHERDDVLRYKHYCALHTQPELDLAEQTDTVLLFTHADRDGLTKGQDDFVDSYEITYDPETPNKLNTYYTITWADGTMRHRKGSLTRVE